MSRRRASPISSGSCSARGRMPESIAARLAADDARLLGVPGRRRDVEGEAPGRPRVPRLPTWRPGGVAARTRSASTDGWPQTSTWGSSRSAGPRGRAHAGRRRPIVDWAVHMRRLPDGRARRPCWRGGRGPRRPGRAAARLAAFLNEARRDPGVRRRTPCDPNVDENFSQVEPFSAISSIAPTFDQVRAFQLGDADTAARRFTRRHRRGPHPRGARRSAPGTHLLSLDARAASIPRIDCIEFNERFRCGDGPARRRSWRWSSRRAPARSGGRVRGPLRRGERRLRALRRARLLPVVPRLGAGQGRRRSGGGPTAAGEVRATRKRDEARRRFALRAIVRGAPVDARS